jgi:cytochrome c oxidase assembly protein subunit 15
MFHFSLALFIIAYCLWLWLELGAKRTPLPAAARVWSTALIWTAGVQMALGALVAGLDAGRGYTDWPTMGGQFVPERIWALEPFWRNFTENEATAQFFHRIVAYLLFALALAAAWRVRAAGLMQFPLFAGLISAQAVLGIVTLTQGAPLGLSLLHQALGVIVLLAATRLAWASAGPTGSTAGLARR